MTGIFTPTGLTAVTLINDGARLFGQVLDLGGQAQEQVTPLFRTQYPARFLRGNVTGRCVVAAWKSHASAGAAAAYWVSQYGMLNLDGVLKLTIDSTIMTMAGATLRAVTREEWDGRYLRIRYEFGIDGFTAPESD